MNQFKKHDDNLYDTKFIAHQLHKAITSPLPVVPKPGSYPPEWDMPKRKVKLPPLTVILSNHGYVVVCVLFTSIIVLIAMIKVIGLVIAK